MKNQSSIKYPQSNFNLGKTRTKHSQLLASRLPWQSLGHIFAIPSCGDDLSPLPGNDLTCVGRASLTEDQPRVEITSIPSMNGACHHQVYVEHEMRLKKLDLPATSGVALSQRFEAAAGDTLSFDYVVLLLSGGGFVAHCPAVQAVLVNNGAEFVVSLIDRSIDGGSFFHPQRVGSRFRETHSLTIPTSSYYELRFTTFVDGCQPGAEAHLLVDLIRVVSTAGQEVRRLASLSCVGRVRRSVLD